MNPAGYHHAPRVRAPRDYSVHWELALPLERGVTRYHLRGVPAPYVPACMDRSEFQAPGTVPRER